MTKLALLVMLALGIGMAAGALLDAVPEQVPGMCHTGCTAGQHP